MSELCARCGEEGEDRRTLWMACFYAMQELGIMFDRSIALLPPPSAELNVAEEPTVLDIPNGPSITIGSGKVQTDALLTPMQFFTLRVCKDCRADWMQAIVSWFNSSQNKGPGTGIFIRRNGANVEVTEEEFRKFKEEQNR
jgi:hypothetical protein